MKKKDVFFGEEYIFVKNVVQFELRCIKIDENNIVFV